MGKKFYKSKTFWINIIALVAFILQSYNGFIISPEEQGALLVVINLIMRFITKEELEV